MKHMWRWVGKSDHVNDGKGGVTAGQLGADIGQHERFVTEKMARKNNEHLI